MKLELFVLVGLMLAGCRSSKPKPWHERGPVLMGHEYYLDDKTGKHLCLFCNRDQEEAASCEACLKARGEPAKK